MVTCIQFYGVSVPLFWLHYQHHTCSSSITVLTSNERHQESRSMMDANKLWPNIISAVHKVQPKTKTAQLFCILYFIGSEWFIHQILHQKSKGTSSLARYCRHLWHGANSNASSWLHFLGGCCCGSCCVIPLALLYLTTFFICILSAKQD